ncbi:uncharacterized protein L969DRAFT_86610 [Mixia osmundae IAM 14324]|nr:uncharacterized protein L969DRAFT_86610 [Mixia osmundae IAM 14324]KEI40009.1 hypothetical protein L969DRAFT_86610 [Mixia osmundae IAM 14324]
MAKASPRKAGSKPSSSGSKSGSKKATPAGPAAATRSSKPDLVSLESPKPSTQSGSGSSGKFAWTAIAIFLGYVILINLIKYSPGLDAYITTRQDKATRWIYDSAPEYLPAGVRSEIAKTGGAWIKAFNDQKEAGKQFVSAKFGTMAQQNVGVPLQQEMTRESQNVLDAAGQIIDAGKTKLEELYERAGGMDVDDLLSVAQEYARSHSGDSHAEL